MRKTLDDFLRLLTMLSNEQDIHSLLEKTGSKASVMSKGRHIDSDLFKLFLSSGVYLEYAHKYLKPEQIDEVDIAEYL